jgi:hypothetical protein
MRTITGMASIADSSFCPANACFLLTDCIWSGLSRITKEAEANKLKLTPEYLELRFIESIANNTKIFFGEKIPNMIMDQRLIRNYLDSAASKDRLEVE